MAWRRKEGAGRVDGLNVNDDERRTTIEITDHDVWLLRQAGAIPAHPSLYGGVTAGARALGYDAALVEGGSEDDDKGLTHMVIDCGVEAYAVGLGGATRGPAGTSRASAGSREKGRPQVRSGILAYTV